MIYLFILFYFIFNCVNCDAQTHDTQRDVTYVCFLFFAFVLVVMWMVMNVHLYLSANYSFFLIYLLNSYRKYKEKRIISRWLYNLHRTRCMREREKKRETERERDLGFLAFSKEEPSGLSPWERVSICHTYT